MTEHDFTNYGKPRRRRLWTFIVVVSSIVALMLGNTWLKSWRHGNAEIALHSIGVESIDRFEDPPGPNWMYTGGQDFLPGDGYFPQWFADYLCLKGNTIYFAAEISLDVDQLEWFTDLINMKSLSVRSSSVPERWVQILGRCRDLESLQVTDIPLTSHDLRDIGELRLRTVTFNLVELSVHQKTLIESLSQIEGLQIVRLTKTDLSEDAVKQLQEMLPDCTFELF